MAVESVLLRIAIALLSALGVVLFFAARARAQVRKKLAPPGEMVDVGGYRLHIQAAGQGEPAVVVDAGLGDFGLGWVLVLPQVAPFARVYAYDRAGLGWSDPSPRPRTSEVMVEELHTLLEQAGVPAPYILAGHSLGGLNARLYAHRYPDEVAGLVLVDAAHEEQYQDPELGAGFRQISAMARGMVGTMEFLIRTGLPALRPSLLPGRPEQLPPDVAETYHGLRIADPRNVKTGGAEMAAVLDSHAQIRAAGLGSLGDLPLAVVMHGRPDPMMTPELTAANERVFQDVQSRLAALSSGSQVLVAAESGHNVPLEQPDVIVEAIRLVHDAARRRLGLLPAEVVVAPKDVPVPPTVPAVPIAGAGL